MNGTVSCIISNEDRINCNISVSDNLKYSGHILFISFSSWLINFTF